MIEPEDVQWLEADDDGILDPVTRAWLVLIGLAAVMVGAGLLVVAVSLVA